MKQTITSVALLLLSGFFFSCGKEEETKKEAVAPTQISIQEIREGSQTETLRYSGSVEAENSVQIGFAAPGTVTSVLVKEGQVVKAGQLLATIDPTEYDNALLIANAGLEQAQDMYNRLNGLYQKGSLPAKDFIDIKSKLAQAQANKNLATKRVKDTRLHAPMSGIITAKLIEKGATAAPGVPAFTIINTSKVYATVSVPESEIGKVTKGQQANVFIATLNQDFSGRIAIINPVSDVVTKTYSVKIELSNASGKLLPGMLTEAKIATGQQLTTITVPTKAIVRDADNITYVYLANDNKAVKKRITAGGLSGNDIVISEGLKTGDKVVVAGQTKLKEGAPVSINL